MEKGVTKQLSPTIQGQSEKENSFLKKILKKLGPALCKLLLRSGRYSNVLSQVLHLLSRCILKIGWAFPTRSIITIFTSMQTESTVLAEFQTSKVALILKSIANNNCRPVSVWGISQWNSVILLWNTLLSESWLVVAVSVSRHIYVPRHLKEFSSEPFNLLLFCGLLYAALIFWSLHGVTLKDWFLATVGHISHCTCKSAASTDGSSWVDACRGKLIPSCRNTNNNILCVTLLMDS